MSKNINYSILATILALCMCVGAGADYTFSLIDHPNAGDSAYQGTYVNGIEGSNIVGYYSDSNGVSVGFVAVPEPGTLLLLGLGGLLLGRCRRHLQG